MKHPAVLMAAVVGNPDPVRGERFRAFVAAKPGIETAPGLSDAIRASVGERLAYYKAPGRSSFFQSCRSPRLGRSSVASCAPGQAQ